ncbi:MAG: hypothetical protein GY854_10000 [Deltaproteobacteria bacterium]|nr:hypothetical protein [Deltaproteobacteria bacterium]
MKKVLLIGVAALLVLGCATTSGTDTQVASHPSAMRVDMGAQSAMPATKPALVEYNTKVETTYRPTEHQMAVINHNKEAKEKASNISYWSISQVERSDTAEAKLKQDIQAKAKAMTMDENDGPGPSIHDKNNKKKQREAIKKLKAQKEAMNTLNEGGPSITDKYRLDLTGKDLNQSKMPGNGLCSGTPKRTFMRADECRHGSCIDSSRSAKGKIGVLGNPYDHP